MSQWDEDLFLTFKDFLKPVALELSLIIDIIGKLGESHSNKKNNTISNFCYYKGLKFRDKLAVHKTHWLYIALLLLLYSLINRINEIKYTFHVLFVIYIEHLY